MMHSYTFIVTVDEADEFETLKTPSEEWPTTALEHALAASFMLAEVSDEGDYVEAIHETTQRGWCKLAVSDDVRNATLPYTVAVQIEARTDKYLRNLGSIGLLHVERLARTHDH